MDFNEGDGWLNITNLDRRLKKKKIKSYPDILCRCLLYTAISDPDCVIHAHTHILLTHTRHVSMGAHVSICCSTITVVLVSTDSHINSKSCWKAPPAKWQLLPLERQRVPPLALPAGSQVAAKGMCRPWSQVMSLATSSSISVLARSFSFCIIAMYEGFQFFACMDRVLTPKGQKGNVTLG